MNIMEILKNMGVEIPEEIMPIMEQAQKCIDCGYTLDDVICVINTALYIKEHEGINKSAICGG